MSPRRVSSNIEKTESEGKGAEGAGGGGGDVKVATCRR
jgi:hypothetical protein